MTDTPDTPPHIPDDPPAAANRHADVLAAMDRIQNRKPDWSRTAILAMVSVVLFTGAGALTELLQFLIILLGVLVLHELGHYVSMRWFSYRNEKMFFLPFFRSATTGQAYNVDSWKKIVVSLMGPVPGIGIGCLLGVLAVHARDSPDASILSHELLFKIATIAIVINGFNLLPILPLDGGWIMHALLFCRNPVFDTGSRLFAAIILLIFGITLGAWFFLFIGAFLLLGLPASYRMAQLTLRLRDKGIQRRAAADGDIPPDTAAEIINGVERFTDHPASTQVVATQSLRVFETLNTVPPGIFLSFFLAAVHTFSLIAAITIAFVLMVENQGSSISEFLDLAKKAPPHTYHCGSIETWHSQDWQPDLADKSLLLIAHRASAEDAEQEFKTLTDHPAASGSIMRFGQTLLIDTETDRARNAWQQILAAGGDILSSGPVTVQVHGILPTITLAHDAVSDCEEYAESFGCAAWLAPPWSHADSLTADGHDYIRRARRTFARVRDRERELLSQAGPDIDKAKQLEILQKCVAEIRRTVTEPVERQVLKLMLELRHTASDAPVPPEPPEKLARLLGQLNTKTEDTALQDHRLSGCTRLVATQGAFLVFIEVSNFQSTTAGLARISKWLCGQGTGQIQYNITSTPSEEE